MPEFPHQNGLSFGFNPTSFCPKVEKLFTEKINEALGEKWRVVTQSTIRAEYDLAKDTGYFRVQIVNNKLFGVPAKCCPGSPRHSKCCTERLGPREKYTLAQLWMVLKQFPDQIPDVDFILNTRDEPTVPNRAPIFLTLCMIQASQTNMVEIFQFLIDLTVLISAIIRTDMGSQHHGQNEIQNSFGGVDQLVLISIGSTCTSQKILLRSLMLQLIIILPHVQIYVILQVNIQK